MDDRILLSASVVPEGEIPPPPTASDLLAGLLGGGISLLTQQVDILKILPPEPTDFKFFSGFSGEFLKLHEYLFNFSRELIKGELTSFKVNTLEQKVHDVFLKVDVLVPGLDDDLEQKVLPAVQRLQDTALNFTNTLLKFPLVGEGLAQKVKIQFTSLNDDFLKAGELAYKFSEQFLKMELSDNKINDVLLTIGGVLNKSEQSIGLLDEASQKVLLPAVHQFGSDLSQLLGGLSGGEDFQGGVVLPDVTDSVIADI